MDSIFFHSSEKGFTLFTALLSFVLILLAGLLVNTMITSERTSNEVVLDVEAQSRMQSLADLTRADALQVVNYGIRNAIEEYSQDRGNSYPYTSQTFADTTPAGAWQNVQDDFSRFFFGRGNGSILSGRIASNLYVIVQSSPRSVGGYTISTKGGQETEIKQAIQSVLAQTNSNEENFLQIVRCEWDTNAESCVGSFYVNLDFSLLDDSEYEKLPAIHVFDESSKRELVEPIIPRGKFRIYVPLRIFKALKYAHEIAQGSQLANGGGLLSPAFHARLGDLGVGMCDGVDASGQTICGYRTAPFTPAALSVGPDFPPFTPPLQSVTGGNLCPSELAPPQLESKYPNDVPLHCDAVAQSLGLCNIVGQVVTTYNPAEATSRASALSTLVEDIINNHVTVSLSAILQSDDFQLLTNQLDIQPSIGSFSTKDILLEGLFSSSAFTEAKCSKLVNTNVTLRFEENNLNYIVVDSRAPLHYEVRIVDSFVPEITKNTCVSYCLQDTSPSGVAGLFIFGPTLSADAAFCNQTACSAPNDPRFERVPECGNGIVESGEDCEFVPNVFASISTELPIDETCESKTDAQHIYTGGALHCGLPGAADACKFTFDSCEYCGDGQKTGSEICDPALALSCPDPGSTCNATCMSCDVPPTP